jgi:hypothetical protein
VGEINFFGASPRVPLFCIGIAIPSPFPPGRDSIYGNLVNTSALPASCMIPADFRRAAQGIGSLKKEGL